jgi:hypothetical protein
VRIALQVVMKNDRDLTEIRPLYLILGVFDLILRVLDLVLRIFGCTVVPQRRGRTEGPHT